MMPLEFVKDGEIPDEQLYLMLQKLEQIDAKKDPNDTNKRGAFIKEDLAFLNLDKDRGRGFHRHNRIDKKIADQILIAIQKRSLLPLRELEDDLFDTLQQSFLEYIYEIYTQTEHKKLIGNFEKYTIFDNFVNLHVSGTGGDYGKQISVYPYPDYEKIFTDKLREVIRSYVREKLQQVKHDTYYKQVGSLNDKLLNTGRYMQSLHAAYTFKRDNDKKLTIQFAE